MKIFLGIPSCRRYEPFWKSMEEFIPILSRQCDVIFCTVHNKTVAEARNMIVDMFLKSDADYLLFLDDDHRGHTLQMFNSLLDPLLNNGSFMCGIKCRAKKFPYASNLLIYSKVDEEKLGIKKGCGKYMPINLHKGYAYCDLVGFGMTLISRETFNRIESPYFISDPEVGQGREDNYFCDKLVKIGKYPVGCFDYTLEHQGIGFHNADILYEQGLAELKKKYPDMKVLVS